MLESILQDVALFLGAIHLAGPLVVRYTMRFAAHCNPQELPLEELPPEVASLFRPRIEEFGSLGFELLGCYDCGTLTSETHSYLAYFRNQITNDFANITVMATPKRTISYFEFSTRFTDGFVLETNTNGSLPLTPENPAYRIFRFPGIQQVSALYLIHRQLIERYAPGMWPQGEPKGEEWRRFVHVLEDYGPRLARIGYMCLSEDGESYELTWKGAFLMTWRGLWPTSLLRRQWQRHAMQVELHSLEIRGITALQKA